MSRFHGGHLQWGMGVPMPHCRPLSPSLSPSPLSLSVRLSCLPLCPHLPITLSLYPPLHLSLPFCPPLSFPLHSPLPLPISFSLFLSVPLSLLSLSCPDPRVIQYSLSVLSIRNVTFSSKPSFYVFLLRFVGQMVRRYSVLVTHATTHARLRLPGQLLPGAWFRSLRHQRKLYHRYRSGKPQSR